MAAELAAIALSMCCKLAAAAVADGLEQNLACFASQLVAIGGKPTLCLSAVGTASRLAVLAFTFVVVVVVVVVVEGSPCLVTAAFIVAAASWGWADRNCHTGHQLGYRTDPYYFQIYFIILIKHHPI